jgi:hypothetical protein
MRGSDATRAVVETLKPLGISELNDSAGLRSEKTRLQKITQRGCQCPITLQPYHHPAPSLCRTHRGWYLQCRVLEGAKVGCWDVLVGSPGCKYQCGNGVMFLPAVRCLSGLPPRNFPRDSTWSDFRQASVTGQHPQEPTTSQSVEAVRALTNHRSLLLAEFSANG